MDPATAVPAVVAIVAGYFIGGIPWGIIVARLVGGPDPRTLGSGRTGGANVMRALGTGPALVAGLLDAAKGAVAVLVAIALGTDPLVQSLAAIAAIVGHSRSPYIGFKGGRGVAPGWGALVVIEPVVAMAAIPVFVGILLATRISSVASLSTSVASAIGLAVMAVILGRPWAFVGFGLAAAAIIWVFHADNIQRLLAGQERRIEFRSPISR